MKNITPRSAGIFSAILALVLLICIYTMLGTVDIVFLQDGREMYRINDAGIFSDLTAPEADGVYVYTADGVEKEFSDSFEFRAHIGTTVILNLVSFKWDEADNIIEIHDK